MAKESRGPAGLVRAAAVARRVASLLGEAGAGVALDAVPPAATLRLLCTGNPAGLQRAAQRWLGSTAPAQPLLLADLDCALPTPRRG